MVALLSLVLGGLWIARTSRTTKSSATSSHAGSSSCIACHQSQYESWKASHHARAQVPVTSDTVAATRSDGPLTRDRGEIRLTVEGTRGAEQFTVASVIGVDPLVQFLVRADRGRLQTSSLAYDVRKKEWFDLHAGENRRPEEWGHWLNRGMTWNFQCAHCHTTDFRKNYSVELDLYESLFVEEGVGCESCHGPRAEHVENPPALGVPSHGTKTQGVRRSIPDSRIESCAPCHSRRAQVAEGFTAELGDQRPGNTFLDFFDPALPDDPAYYADGQVRDEDYEWASFRQSKMHAKGVGCTDCHDAHTARVRHEGNSLCLQCHKPELEAFAHTHHRSGSAGTLCVSCHMPQTTYMLRHPRRDHAFTKPLPELTIRLGIPNACNRCHVNRTPAWAQEKFEASYGKGSRPVLARALLVAAARAGRNDAVPGLLDLLQASEETPSVWRAAAASLLAPWAGRADVRRVLEHSLSDIEPLVRARAARALERAPGGTASALARVLLDPVRLVRLSAAYGLWATPTEWAATAAEELIAAARQNADTPAGRYTLGLYNSHRRQDLAAEAEYRKALAFDPAFFPARANLGVLLAATTRHAEVVTLLEEGVRLTPEEPSLWFNLALAYSDAGRLDAAIRSLEELVRIAPAYPRAQYNLGVAYFQRGRRRDARARFAEALRLEPGNADARRMLQDVTDKR